MLSGRGVRAGHGEGCQEALQAGSVPATLVGIQQLSVLWPPAWRHINIPPRDTAMQESLWGDTQEHSHVTYVQGADFR